MSGIAILAPLAAVAQQAGGAGTAQSETLVLDPIIVDAVRDAVLTSDGYVTRSSRTAAKSDIPLVRMPQSVSTVTQQQLEDQKPPTLNEALAYTPGTNPNAYGFDPRFDAFFIRGFPATYTGVYRDGLRQLSSPTGLFRVEPYGLEGMTILKGPSSALYGASNAGGIVDLISKRPLSTPLREVELVAGSNDRYQGNFDFSGPINEDGSLLYRLTGAVRDSDTALPGFPDNRTFIAPAVTWRGEDSTLTLLGEYMDSTIGGTAAYLNDANGATRIYEGDPRYNDFRQQQARIGYEFTHRFSDSLTVRQKARYAWLDNDLEYAYYSPYPTHLAGRNAETVKTFGIDNQIEWKGATGGFNHTVLLGSDLTYVDYEQSQGFGFLPGDGPTPGLAFTAAQEQLNVGVYAQDQVTYGSWTLLLGARYDWLSGDSWTPDAATEAEDRIRSGSKDEAFTGRVGLSYLTEWGIAPYVSYSTGFALNVGMLQDNTPAVPTLSEQIEAGVKYDIPDYNASVTASVFDITQSDGVVFLVDGQGKNTQVQNDLHSRGFEIEGKASLGNGLSVIASYAYVDMEIEKGLDGTVGNTLSATPFHTGSIWADYSFQSGALEGFGLGGGLRYVGMSFGNDENTMKNDPRLLLDAGLHYDLGALNPEWKGTRLQLNATNLLDTTEQTCASGYCYWDKGRTVLLSLRHRW